MDFKTKDAYFDKTCVNYTMQSRRSHKPFFVKMCAELNDTQPVLQKFL